MIRQFISPSSNDSVFFSIDKDDTLPNWKWVDIRISNGDTAFTISEDIDTIEKLDVVLDYVSAIKEFLEDSIRILRLERNAIEEVNGS